MNLLGMPWTALMHLQPQRSHQIAWFAYGWIEREHILNVTACELLWKKLTHWHCALRPSACWEGMLKR